MMFISTKDPKQKVGFKEAVQLGLAPDGGLFVPESIPKLDDSFLNRLHDLNLREIAFKILYPYVKEDLDEDQLQKIILHTFSFDICLKPIADSHILVLELFHGPTWAFKDVGARFLAGCLSAWKEGKEETIILVATSGDTGGAVANGFYNQEGIRVIILYPKGKISPLQEQQIAGLGGNITAVAVDGSFDDCQQLVKTAFNDKVLRSKINITSANSINVARWLPQMIFYAVAWKEMQQKKLESVLCIPSGNYGNITAAFLLHAMGMRFQSIIAAHNANDTIPRFLTEGFYHPGATISTLANAMDVSDPSNFVRLQYLLEHEVKNAGSVFYAATVSDEQILESIREAWNHHQYLLDPHTATAWNVLKRYDGNGSIVATAHPAKFEEVIIRALGFYPIEWKKVWESGPVHSISIPVSNGALQEILLASR